MPSSAALARRPRDVLRWSSHVLLCSLASIAANDKDEIGIRWDTGHPARAVVTLAAGRISTRGRSLLDQVTESNMVEAAGAESPELEQLAQYREQVRRHLLAMVHDPELADDLTQETYRRALGRVQSLRDPRAGLSWLYRIATNVALDRLRQRRPTTIPLDALNLGRGGSCSRAGGAQVITTRSRPGALGDVRVRPDYLESAARPLSRRDPPPRRAGCQQPRDLRTRRLLAGHREDPGASGAAAPPRAALAAACEFGLDERGVLVCDEQASGADAVVNSAV